MAKPAIIYKTTILYLLNRSTCPLSNLQIADFFLQEEYTDYFNVQEILAELTESGHIIPTSTHESTLYSLTEAGEEALRLLNDKVSFEMKEDVKKFFVKNQMQIKQTNSVFSDYKRSGDSYLITLKVREDETEQLSLSLRVHSKEQAESICNSWKKKWEDVYDFLMDSLIQ